MLASADIAALILAFPPASPTKTNPSLVRSNSGNTLLDSRKVTARFRSLLETSPHRLRLFDLPRQLGISDTGWLIDSTAHHLLYSTDRQSIIPGPVQQELAQALSKASRDGYMEIASFATEHDIHLESLELMNSTLPDLELGSHIDPLTRKRYWAHADYLVRSLEPDLKASIGSASSAPISLSKRHPTVPPGLLLEQARAILEAESTIRGTVEYDGGDVIFTSSDFQETVAQQQRKAHEHIIQHLAQELQTNGFCSLPKSDAARDESATVEHDVTTALKHLDASDDVVRIGSANGAVTLVLKRQLEQAVSSLTISAGELVRQQCQSRTESQDSADVLPRTLTGLQATSSSPGLTAIILQSPEQIKSITDTARAAIATCVQADEEAFVLQLRERFLAPVLLYAKGLAVVTDATLTQHLEEFLSDYFRREALPAFVTDLRDRRLLIESTRKREVERLQQACDACKTFTDLQAASAKFAKKQKIALPDAAMLAKVKGQILLQKTALMRKMSRGSDVLQNLIWILLARKTEGLFMSSGKNTTRMIRLYQSVDASSDIGARLEAWRDMLKTGKESKNDLTEMRELAAHEAGQEVQM